MAEIQWENSKRALERILVFGVEGTGKTRAAFDIMEKVKGNFHYIETDNTLDEFLDARNVDEAKLTEYRVRDWRSTIEAMNEAWSKVEKQDWVIIDNASNIWSAVQQWYVEKVYGKDLDEFLMAARIKQIEKGDGNHTSIEAIYHDWGTINAQYQQFRDLNLNPKCNLFITAGMKEMSKEDQKDKVLRTAFGTFGVKPDGQKRLANDVRTVLLFGRDDRFGEETYTITTTKDRERAKLREEPWENFFDGYLRKNGWKPAPQGAASPAPSALSAPHSISERSGTLRVKSNNG